MKTNNFKFPLLIILFFLNSNVYSQYPNWINYYNGGSTSGFAFEGNTVWTSSDFGIVATDTASGSKQFFTKTNSPLTTNFCNNIQVDQNSKKWIATRKGVNVFDGVSWTNYNTVNSPLLSDEANDIAVDSTNNKWVATSQGLAKFDGTNWTIYTTANSGLQNDTIYKLAFDHTGNLWMGCGSNPVCLTIFDGVSWQSGSYTFQPNIGRVTITGLSIGLSGKAYMSVSFLLPFTSIQTGDILQYFNSAWSLVPVNYPPDCGTYYQRYVTALYVDSLENIWFGTSTYRFPNPYQCNSDGYLGKYDGAVTTIYPYLPATGLAERNVKSIKFDSNGNCWVGNSYSVFQKYSGLNWTNYSSSNSKLRSNDIYDLKIDRSNNKWMVAPFDEIYKFDSMNWFDENDLDSCYENTICCAAFDTNNVGYFGSLGSLTIRRFDGLNCTQTNINSTGWSGLTMLMESDSLNRVWVGTSGNGAYMYDGSWHNFSTYNSLLPTNEVEGIFFDSNNNAWIGMNGDWPGGGGLAKYDGTNMTYYNTPNLPYYTVTCGAEDLNGSMWIGTGSFWGWPMGEGLVVFDGVNWTVYNTSNTILPSDNIISIARDLNGDMWIGTNNGLVKYDGSTWQLYNTDNSGLFSNVIEKIRVDQWGNKWFGTTAGLAAFRQGGIALSDAQSNVNNESSFICYPNPASNYMDIKIINKNILLNNFSIFNLLGEKVMEIPIEKYSENVHYKINLANLNNGIYFLKLRSSGGVMTKKIVVSH